MLAAAVLALVASQDGILAVDGLWAIGLFRKASWKTPDSHDATATIVELTSGPCFVLKKDGTTDQIKRSLKFIKDGDPESDPYSVDKWIVQGAPIDIEYRPLLWFGPKPQAPKVIHAGHNSPVYLKIAKDYLRSKGFKNAKPVLNEVAIVDLDGDGNEEALISMSSIPSDQIRPRNTGGTNADYAAWIIRYMKGSKVKTTEMSFSTKKGGGMTDGTERLEGLWNLDGRPGVEIVMSGMGWESSWNSLYQFKNGKVRLVSEVGGGA